MNAILRKKYEADQLSAKASSKIEMADDKLAAGDAALVEKLDKLIEKVSVVLAYQKALFWVFSPIGAVAGAYIVAHNFGWI